MTSKSLNLFALQMRTGQNFSDNLEHLRDLIRECPPDSIILAPEVCLSNFCYQKMEEAAEFSKEASAEILRLCADRTIALSMIEKMRGGFFNNFKVFSHGELAHTQSKHKLFPLGNEHLHFQAGSEEEIREFSLKGGFGSIKCAALNCFELRFVEFWQKIKGVDLIFVPAQWGKERKEHFETLSRALAITTQSFVLCASGANDSCAKGSAIITPFGNVNKDDTKKIVGAKVGLDEIERVRKFIDIGL